MRPSSSSARTPSVSTGACTRSHVAMKGAWRSATPGRGRRTTSSTFASRCSSRPRSLVAAGAIAGVVGTVDDMRYGGETLARATRDLSELAPYAKAHQDVVQYVFERAPAVVPIAFGSLHHTDEDVRRSLEEQSAR